MAMANFPDFIIAGSAKSGTTAIHLMLDQHPNVTMSETKETNFFVHGFEKTDHYIGLKGEPVFAGLADPDRIDTLDKYRAVFSETIDPGHILGESSPLYLISPQVPKRIKAQNPKAKIVLSLRNPSDVAFANFVHLVREGAESLSIEQIDQIFDERRYSGENLYPFCDHLSLPRYARHLPVWLETIGKENIHVLIYEEFRANRRRALSGLFDFLGLNDDVEIDVHRKVNVSGMPRSTKVRDLIQGSMGFKSILKRVVPTGPRRKLRQALETLNTGKRVAMPDDIRLRLDNLYSDDVLYVESLLGREIPEWRRLRLNSTKHQQVLS